MATFDEFDEVAKGQGQGSSKLDDWFRPPEGLSRIRILSGYEPLARHFRGKGVKPLVCVGKDKGCPFHSQDDESAGVKYLMWIIDRKDNEIKIGELPYTVVKPVADLKNDPEYGFEKLPNWDITIKKTVSGSRASDVEYTVVPARQNTDLTSEEVNAFMDKTPIEKVVERIKEKALRGLRPEKKEVQEVKVEDEINIDEIPF